MYSALDTPCGVGCPIRKSPDQRVFASPRSLSQRITSFIASQCQGIHQLPLVCLILIGRQKSQFMDWFSNRFLPQPFVSDVFIRYPLLEEQTKELP
jgi:hypothetical protein